MKALFKQKVEIPFLNFDQTEEFVIIESNNYGVNTILSFNYNEGSKDNLKTSFQQILRCLPKSFSLQKQDVIFPLLRETQTYLSIAFQSSRTNYVEKERKIFKEKVKEIYNIFISNNILVSFLNQREMVDIYNRYMSADYISANNQLAFKNRIISENLIQFGDDRFFQTISFIDFTERNSDDKSSENNLINYDFLYAVPADILIVNQNIWTLSKKELQSIQDKQEDDTFIGFDANINVQIITNTLEQLDASIDVIKLGAAKMGVYLSRENSNQRELYLSGFLGNNTEFSPLERFKVGEKELLNYLFYTN